MKPERFRNRFSVDAWQGDAPAASLPNGGLARPRDRGDAGVQI